MVAKTTKCRRVKQAAKYEQDKLAVKHRRVRLAAKYEQAKLAIKHRQSKRKKASTSKRSSYSIKQKKQVVAYAKSNGRNEAARHFQLNGSMVGRWIKASEKWTTETKRYTMKVGSGRKAFYPEAEKKLYNWIIEQRKQGLAVTYTTAKITMFDILEEPEMIALYGNSTEKFKASFRWLTLFMKRYKLSLRQRTKIFQKLLKQTEESLEKFQQFVTRLRIQKSFEFSNIFNMDETPVWFDMVGNFTINAIGKRKPRGEQFPDGIIVWFQENGWMDANIMKNYIDYLVEEVDEPELPKMMVKRSWDNISDEVIIRSFKKCGISNSLNELEDIENNDVDEINEEGDEELVIEVHENLVDMARLQARFEMITLEDDPFFEIKVNFAIHNSEFVDFNKNDWV
ncbi:unnamed protein product [Rhizophagus irregularis]|nr:unnamed protein product [Rhizophagus irregularis]